MRLSALMVLVSGLLLAITPFVRAADPTPEQGRPRPQDGKKVRLDRFGDPLPPGAVARMGSARFRHLRYRAAGAFSPARATNSAERISSDNTSMSQRAGSSNCRSIS